MNVLLIGEDAAGARTLHLLKQSGARIAAVMTSPTRREGGVTNLWDIAAKLGYTTWPAELVREARFATQVREAGVDLILNVHSLFVIRKEILEAPRLGSFNLHPGPLPRYAGLNSVCWAIYRGETQHGVTLHKIEPEIDTGPIVYQEVIAIDGEETGLSLTSKCTNVGIRLISRLLEAAADEPSHIPLTPQDLSKREYFGRRVPENGNLFWNRPAQRIADFVRAADFFPFRSPWGPPLTKRGDATLGITKVRMTGRPAYAPPGVVGTKNDQGVDVACADQWILVRQLFNEGKYIPAHEVLVEGDRLSDCETGRGANV
jgi:methionyl-tRNA formyltransferase